MAESENQQDNPKNPSDRRLTLIMHALLILGLVLSFVETGLQIGGGDHPIHLSFVYQVLNPELFQNDPFVDTVAQYPSVFWGAIASFAKVGVPLFPMIAVLQVFFRWVCVIGVFLLAFEIAEKALPKLNQKQVSLIALGSTYLFLAFNVIHWGGTFMLESTLETSTAAFSPLPFCWYFWIRRQWIGWALAFAFAAWLHPMIGLYIGFVFFLGWLAEGDLYLPTTDEGKSFWFKGGIPSVVLAGSAFVFAYLKSPQGLESFEAWAAVAEYRFPHHFYPSTWSVARFVVWGLIAASCLAAIWFALEGRRRRLFLAGFGGVFFLAVLGTVAPVYYPKPLLISLCLWRSPITWTTAAYCVLIPFAVKLIYREEKGRWIPLSLSVAAFAVLIFISVNGILTRMKYPVDQDRKAVMEWIEENSEADDIVLAPILLSGTRLETKRNVFVEWKDGAAHLWNPIYASTIWIERLSDIAGIERTTTNGLPRPSTYSEARADYENLINDPERLLELSREEGIDWIVVKGEVTEEFEEIISEENYRVNEWSVYSVP